MNGRDPQEDAQAEESGPPADAADALRDAPTMFDPADALRDAPTLFDPAEAMEARSADDGDLLEGDAPTVVQHHDPRSGMALGAGPLDANAPTLIQPAGGSGAPLDPSTPTLIQPPLVPGSTPGSGLVPSTAGDLPTLDGVPGVAPGTAGAGSGRGTRRTGLRSGPSSGLRSGSVRTYGAGGTIGELFAGKYELLDEIARGGMGVVYKARQVDLNRVVALKLMLSGSYASEEERRRFLLEAEASARLKHPNIVPVYDIGEVDGNLYFTMDFVEGAPLSARKKELGREQLLKLMLAVCDAVAYAHQRGIIHRDLKPANIMMNAADEPLIMDFGLAKQVEVVDAEGQPSLATREGSVMGTPHYMPPEQAEGTVSEIDVRSDVYALGVILYELWTGKLPFEARSISELLMKIFEVDPTPPRQIDPTIDPDLEAIVLKAIEKPKARRYDSAADLKRDLERMRDGLPISARRATSFYRLQKWTRRNRARLVAVGALLLVASTSLFVVVRQSQAAAREREADARAALEEAREQRVPAATQQAQRAEEAVRALVEDDQPVADRAVATGGLATQVRQAVDAVVAARDLLSPYKERDEARPLLEQCAARERALQDARSRLTTLVRVHEHLDEAARALAAAEELKAPAFEALSRTDDATAAPTYDDLEQARAALAEQLVQLRAAKQETGASGAQAAAGASESSDERLLRARLTEAERSLFTVISLSGSLADDGKGRSLPEATAAEAQLKRINDLRQELAAVESGAAKRRLARQLLVGARELLRLLEESRGAVDAGQQLRTVRLAQELVQRGLEADANAAGLDEARRFANYTYAGVLLLMKAYDIFDVELEKPDFVTDEQRAHLTARKAELLKQVEAVRQELARIAAAVDRRDVDGLIADRARLIEVEAEVASMEADDRARYDVVRATVARLLSERVRVEVSGALSLARNASADLSPSDVATRLAELRTRWEQAKRVVERRAEHLSPEQRSEASRDCARGLADLQRAAAKGLERADLPAAQALAEAAASAYARLHEQGHATEAERDAANAQAERLRRLREKPDGMVLLPGARGVELGGGPTDRNEPRRVDLPPFYLAVREVTNAEYARYLADHAEASPPAGWTSRIAPEGTDELPVTGITFAEAQAFAEAQGMRLPSDDEWECAARLQGEGTTRFPWGDEWREGLLASTLQPPQSNPDDRTARGLFDMGGNVSEWVARPDGTPAARGASWLFPFPEMARGAHRLHPRPEYRGPQLGLRLAKDSQ